MAIVCWPPRLRLSQQGLDVCLECIIYIASGACIQRLKPLRGACNLRGLTVQRGESGGIVKARAERVLLGRKLAEDIQPQLTRPPVTAPGAAARSIADGRTLAEGVSERAEGRLVPSREQEVSLVDAAGKGTAGGGQRQEPEKEGPDGGRHGSSSSRAGSL
jgi:hypothetical protein